LPSGRGRVAAASGLFGGSGAAPSTPRAAAGGKLTGRAALLEWVNRHIRLERGEEVHDFSKSFSDGRAFVWLMSSLFPQDINPAALTTPLDRFTAAFRVAEAHGVDCNWFRKPNKQKRKKKEKNRGKKKKDKNIVPFTDFVPSFFAFVFVFFLFWVTVQRFWIRRIWWRLAREGLSRIPTLSIFPLCSSGSVRCEHESANGDCLQPNKYSTCTVVFQSDNYKNQTAGVDA
jgi:hypothetical protein